MPQAPSPNLTTRWGVPLLEDYSQGRNTKQICFIYSFHVLLCVTFHCKKKKKDALS